MKIPDFISRYTTKAQKLLSEDKIKELVFSGGTYQVEISDEATYWPFLQIDNQASIKDGFCTCSRSEEEGGCEHLTAAYLYITQGREDPLHVCFEKSFWNQLCKLAAQKLGYSTNALKSNGAQYKSSLITLKPIQKAAEKKLNTIIKNRVEETEDNSIKFSNLSIDEIQAWKSGHVTAELQYELSFWSDLAKWWFLLQDKGKKYSLDFVAQPNKLPHQILFKIGGIEVSFMIDADGWIDIIPSLTNVLSPLKVFEYQGQIIEKINYDEEQICFRIEKHKDHDKKANGTGIVIGQWGYVPEKGFYPLKPDPLLQSSVIESSQISNMLDRYGKTFAQLLSNTTIHSEPVKVHYYLYFDEFSNLHIQAYLFSIHDLEEEGSAFFGNWAYISGKGFYSLKNVQFDKKEKLVAKHEICEFINSNRKWLHQFDGFQAYFQSLQSHLTYEVRENGDLYFDSELDDIKNYENFLDFGEWVYIKGLGFYLKYETSGSMPLSPGQLITKEEVCRFISSHKDQLDLVQGFFTNESPIDEMGLDIHLTEEKTIEIDPIVSFLDGYNKGNVRFFDHYLYLEKVGFYELPDPWCIEKKYQKKVIVREKGFANFFEIELEKLLPKALKIDSRIQKPKRLRIQLKAAVREKRKKQKTWLLDLSYRSEFGSISIYDLVGHLSDTVYFTQAGRLELSSERYQWVRGLDKRRLDAKSKMVRLTTLEWIRLCVYEEVELPTGQSEEAIASRKAIKELESLETSEILDASSLQATLRPYQEVGLQWLWFLYCHELSGLLCDDMGLGKTLQAMGLISAVIAHDPHSRSKYLVVCPTSVIFHWQEQLEKFLPEIRVLVYHGQARSLEPFEQHYDLLLTSYGILRTGRENFCSLRFEVAIFDEVQIAKNHLSQTHKALSKIPARMRLGLTGTPIENNLSELKALLDLALPNYLPKEADFRDQFAIPIEKNGDIHQRRLLSKLIQPFILRRKKADVLKDLPEKTEEVRHCALSNDQKKLYQELAQQSRRHLLNELVDEKKPIPYLHIFSLLSKYKQVCDHPALFEKDPKNYEQYESGKWDLFVELLNEARQSGQKVVVFSQFLDMLEIIERYLKKNKIGYAGIKGSTKNRRGELIRFREDPRCEVFVASLLAAGVGIDLSSASVVIHYDRWWNPAKENQATDRVHRIGQSRGVQVFKLVTIDTVEEDIHRLIEKKANLIEETLGSDDIDQIKLLSREELVEIVRKTCSF